MEYERTTRDKLNPELDEAIDYFFRNLGADAKAKACKGDLDYQGKWLELSEDELKQYLAEELLDLLVYYAMGVHRFGWPLPPFDFRG